MWYRTLISFKLCEDIGRRHRLMEWLLPALLIMLRISEFRTHFYVEERLALAGWSLLINEWSLLWFSCTDRLIYTMLWKPTKGEITAKRECMLNEAKVSIALLLCSWNFQCWQSLGKKKWNENEIYKVMGVRSSRWVCGTLFYMF